MRGSRDTKGWTSAEIDIGVITVKAVVVNGLGNARALIEALQKGEVKYDFVEVMACPGGYVGGGQPIHDVNMLYKNYFDVPLSNKSHRTLHTDHNA